MSMKAKQAIVGAIIITLIVLITVTTILVKKYTPSKEELSLTEYFKSEDNQIAIILQDKLYEKTGRLIDGEVYIDYKTVKEYFNKRFYWDNNENLLIYTTPTEVIKAQVSSKDYYVNKSKSSENYVIVKADGDEAYISLSYIKKFSDIEYTIYDNPNRVVINYKWEEVLYSDIKKSTKLRVEDSIKSAILLELQKDSSVLILEQGEEWTKVQTTDGVSGFVKNKFLKESYGKLLKSNYVKPVYSSIQKDYKISMVWHQVTNQDSNNNLSNLILQTQGVNTVSPTWFSIVDNEGNISSLISETYVSNAHQLGLEVWALIDDFNENIDMFNILSHTSTREKIINELIANVIKYNIDGLNIDFEKITTQSGEHFIQFIRELSVKCRNNGIILSVDNYVPKAYTSHYNRMEQGIVTDYVIIMGYDEHYSGSDESGSVASIAFVEEGIVNTLSEVPKEKVINGIPFYTRLWHEKDGVKIDSEALSMKNAKKIFDTNNVIPTWDDALKQYYGEYEKDGVNYRMWLEEEKSIESKMKLIKQYELAGVACWKLGLEDPLVWNTIIKYTN